MYRQSMHNFSNYTTSVFSLSPSLMNVHSSIHPLTQLLTHTYTHAHMYTHTHTHNIQHTQHKCAKYWPYPGSNDGAGEVSLLIT